MAMAISMASQSSIVVFNMKPSQRFQSNLLRPSCNLGLPKLRTGSGFFSTPRLNDFNTIKIKRDFAVNSSSISPGGSGSPSNSMRGWLLGMVLTIVLPFFTHKWGPLLKWTKNIESMVETVEQIANTVESAGGKIHEVAENIEESLPQGKLRNAFDFIENTAEEIAKGADVAGDLIDKIQEVEDKVDVFIKESERDKETNKVATTIKESERDKETNKVATTSRSTTATTTMTESAAVAQMETQKGDESIELANTINVEVNEVVKELVVTSRQKYNEIDKNVSSVNIN